MKIRVTLEIPEYSSDEMAEVAVEFLQLDRTPDAVDMLMAVLDGSLEITYVVVTEEASDD